MFNKLFLVFPQSQQSSLTARTLFTTKSEHLQKTSIIAAHPRMDVVLTYYRALGCGSVVMKPTFGATYSDLNAHYIVQQGRGQFVKPFIYQELLVIKDNSRITILCLHSGRFLIISYIVSPTRLRVIYNICTSAIMHAREVKC